MTEYKVKVSEYTTEWRNLNDELHRINGPAIEWMNGAKEYFLNGQRHRTNGPAIEYADGSTEWHLNGKQLTETEFNKKMNTVSCSGKEVIIDGKKYKLTEL